MKKARNNQGRELRKIKRVTALQIKEAMKEASDALDLQSQEIIALKRILISERAQVIYYSDKYLAFLGHECLDLQPMNFLDLPEEQQEPYIKRAVIELSDAQRHRSARSGPADGPGADVSSGQEDHPAQLRLWDENGSAAGDSGR